MTQPVYRNATRVIPEAWVLQCDPMWWDLLLEIGRWNAEALEPEKRVILYAPFCESVCA